MLSIGIGRMLGLSKRLAVLVACGNSICGNSAIAAVAPVIGANGDEVASSIAFTAVLGVIVVLLLPLFGVIMQMGQVAFGALAGLTVYAVPQVIAAATPFGSQAVQTGNIGQAHSGPHARPGLPGSLATHRENARGSR